MPLLQGCRTNVMLLYYVVNIFLATTNSTSYQLGGLKVPMMCESCFRSSYHNQLLFISTFHQAPMSVNCNTSTGDLIKLTHLYTQFSA